MVWPKQIGVQKKELAQRHLLRLEFWKQLLEKAKVQTSLHARVSPSKDNWVNAGAGKSGLTFAYIILMQGAQVELGIDTGDAEENERIFQWLFDQKESIESAFGGSLDWDQVDNRRACYLRYHLRGQGLTDQEQWPQTQEAMIEAMVRLENALKPHIQRLS